MILSSKPLLMEGTVLKKLLSQLKNWPYLKKFFYTDYLIRLQSIYVNTVETTEKRFLIDFVRSSIIMNSFVSD